MTAREEFAGEGTRATFFPKVLVETPVPPAFRKGRIGKETAAGIVPPVGYFP